MKRDLVQAVLNTIRRLDMLEEGDKVLLAVSGGPDSVFLFHALYTLKDKLKINISVANMDHGLRGRASEIDSEFAGHLSGIFKIPFIYKKANLERYKDGNLSKEEVARKARYDFLINAAKKSGAEAIATGHTIDDHAETILMRIIKGSAFRGIMGIPAVRVQDGVKIVRPLIDITKRDIERFLKESNIPYRVDHTNLEGVYFRNRIRNRVLPYLRKYNPGIKQALANLAENLREDFEFITAERNRLKSSLPVDEGSLSFKLKDIILQPKAMRKEIMMEALSRAGSDMKKLSYKHWKGIDNFIRLGRKGSSIDLPGSVRIKKAGGTLELFKVGSSNN